ncbi:sulfite exporter TauE/SafE family protein [Aciduricibacillus chroicocephali]|uniref:Probable membrane transporter protein n=1 Tax=Aciduricibacillus chroicocephali TaxID=3054939 RepID=A0ABY9KSZ9_9BACI|nr:sulfite exporter TauE/SafE family protein [Bacillaceae bacterium 44XB]
MVYIICIVTAIATSFAGALLGLGGGVLFVPIMLLFTNFLTGFEWVNPQSIVGVSLIAMIFTTITSTISNSRNGLVDFRLGFYLISGSVPGGIFGSWLSRYIQMENFPLYFGVLLLLISLLFLIEMKSGEEKIDHGKGILRILVVNGTEYRYRISWLKPFFIAFFVGTLSGLFGIGGGSMIVPSLILLFGVPAHIAIATSLFMIIFSSGVGAITHIALGHIPWHYTLYVVPGAIIGGWLGAHVNQILNGKTLIRSLQICLVLIGLYLIVDSML